MTFSGLDFNNVKPLSATPAIDKEVVKADLLADIHNVLSYLLPNGKANNSHLKWEFDYEPLEAVRVTDYLSNRESRRLSSFS